MALIKCIDCGKEISDKAVACPHCGCPAFSQNKNQASENKIFDKPISINNEDISSNYSVTPEYKTEGEVEHINSAISLQTNVKKKKLKRWHKVLIGVASTVCVVVILFVIFVFNPNNKSCEFL